MKFILSFCLLTLFTIHFSSTALASVWVTSVTENNPPSMDCNPTALTVSGDLSASHQFFQSNVSISGSTITIYVEFASGIGIPVITPFSQVVDLGLVPAGTYTVTTYGVLDGQTQSTYTSTLAVGACCGTSAEFIYPNAICIGDIIQLTNSSTGATSQEWFEDGSSASTSIDHSVTPASSGNIVIKLVTSNGTCQDSVEYTIGVFDIPVISALTPSQSEYCEGEQVDITHTSTNTTNYLWQDNGFQVGTNSSLSIVAGMPGPHIFKLLASNAGCTDTMEISIMINVAPTIDSFSASQSSICLGESFDLLSSSTGATSVMWFENGAFLTNGASLTMTPTIAGTYDYMLLVANTNCADSMTTTVSVASSPVIDNSNASPTTLCLGDVLNITSSSSNATSFEWLENGNSIAITSDHSTTPPSGGTYTYELVVGLGNCTDTAEHVINVVPLPDVDLGADTNDCLGPIVLDAGAGSAFLWSDQSTNQTLTPTTTGVYSVTVTDANGCSNTDEMSFESCAGILENSGMNIALYPNPGNAIVNIDIDRYEGEVSIRLVDMKGRLVSASEHFTAGDIELDISFLNSGIFYVELTTNNGNAILKLIKE